MSESSELVRESLQIHLEVVRQRIAQAVSRSGRDLQDVQIVAVTKTHPPEIVRAACAEGLKLIGENRVGEGIEKRAALAELDGLAWHMIGHVQSRKAADVVSAFDMVQSVEGMKLATRLNRFAAQSGRRLPILLECNISGEQAKYGWDLASRTQWPEILEEFEQISAMPQLDVQGLMTVAPWTDDESLLRRVFSDLRELRHFLAVRMPIGPQLSMGMSDDFELAVEEGATLVRLGRVLFGPRRTD
jgi:hypothetical protein